MYSTLTMFMFIVPLCWLEADVIGTEGKANCHYDADYKLAGCGTSETVREFNTIDHQYKTKFVKRMEIQLQS